MLFRSAVAAIALLVGSAIADEPVKQPLEQRLQ
jgi:hypothetical protein